MVVWIIGIVVAVGAVFFYMVVKSRERSGASRLHIRLPVIKIPKLPVFKQDRKSVIERLKEEAEEEKAKSKDLQAVLLAKQEVKKARDVRVELQKKIAGTAKDKTPAGKTVVISPRR